MLFLTIELELVGRNLKNSQQVFAKKMYVTAARGSRLQTLG